MDSRIRDLCSEMKRLGVTVSVIFHPTNLKYFAGTRFAWVLVLRSKANATLVTSNLMANQTENEAFVDEIIKFPATNMFIEKVLGRVMPDLASKTGKIGIEFDYLSSALFRKLSKCFPHLDLVDISTTIKDLRKCKSQEEISLVRRAAEIADEGIETAFNVVKPGISELEVASKVDSAMKEGGAEELGFTTTVASGPRTSLYHPKASAKKIRQGDVVVVDVGPVFGGYHADMTRTMMLGKPTRELMIIYEYVRKMEEKALETTRIGAPCFTIVEAGHSVVRNTRYGKYSYTTFEIGHGVGLDSREAPLLNMENDERILSNMTIAIEPIVCLKQLGVRLEDTVVVGAERAERMTKFDRDLGRI